jgi:CheY-like chemotaxis protein
MCKISELKVLVVESDKGELDKTCSSLTDLGVETIFCVFSFEDAMVMIEKDKTIDLVIADLRLENFKPTGVFLCEMAKKTRPDLLFLISSRISGVSFIGQSLSAGADATMDMTDSLDTNTVLLRWLGLAQKRREVEAIINS